MSLRCFVDELSPPPGREPGPVVRLSEPEARHARLSRRLEVGDAVVLFDGNGHEANGTIALASRSTVEVRLMEFREVPRPAPEFTLAVAMPKGPRQDVLIEKCTELGVARLQPLITERSVAGVSEHKLDKWKRATIEAAKQSGQCWLPQLAAPLPLAKWLKQASGFELVLAAMLPREGQPAPITLLLDRIRSSRSILGLVGPEGGWTQAEVDAMLAAGALPVSLGPHVLRIETAAIAMTALMHACGSAPAGMG